MTPQAFKKLKTVFMTTAAASAMCIAATAAASQEVTLRGVDGNTSITGTLIAFDDKTYTVQTTLGTMTFAADMAVCEGEACPVPPGSQTELVFAGAETATGHLLPQLAMAFANGMAAGMDEAEAAEGISAYDMAHEDGNSLHLALQHGTSNRGITDLLDNTVHAAITTRPVTEAENRVAERQGLGQLLSEAQQHVIAYDGLLVVTHPSNPIRAASEINVAKIFSGEYDDWSQLGGAAAPINIYLREDDSSSRSLLNEVLMKPHRSNVTIRSTVLKTDAEIAAAVREDRHGIGLTSFVHRAGVNTMEIEGVCGIRVPATPFTIKTGEYPLSRPVYLYTDATEQEGLARDFMNYVTSNDAQRAVRQAGFVDREITAEPLNTQGLRVTHAIMQDEDDVDIKGTKSMLKLMSSAQRLSTTVRFGNGSTDLSPQDYDELERLVDLIKSESYTGTVFYFMGFSDSIGRKDLNQFLALQRAEIVRQALVSRYPELAQRIKARSVGYGELSPLACNETRPGRKVNRRVEVWVHNPAAVAINQ